MGNSIVFPTDAEWEKSQQVYANSANHWKCELHQVYCKFGSPCWECKRECMNQDIVDPTDVGRQDIREKNSHPRYVQKVPGRKLGN
jgi:hypothetical protein